VPRNSVPLNTRCAVAKHEPIGSDAMSSPGTDHSLWP